VRVGEQNQVSQHCELDSELVPSPTVLIPDGVSYEEQTHEIFGLIYVRQIRRTMTAVGIDSWSHVLALNAHSNWNLVPIVTCRMITNSSKARLEDRESWDNAVYISFSWQTHAVQDLGIRLISRKATSMSRLCRKPGKCLNRPIMPVIRAIHKFL